MRIHDLYLISVWLHILAAATWIGGMMFIALVVVPSVRRGDLPEPGRLYGETGRRFRAVGWSCFAVLFLTGSFNLSVRGVTLHDFVDAHWLASPFGRAAVIKVSIFAVILVLSAVHDYVIGPRAVAELEHDPKSATAARLRRRAALLGRVNALLALVVLGLAVILVRGWPSFLA